MLKGTSVQVCLSTMLRQGEGDKPPKDLQALHFDE
jgi:hypothetical protein